jgi:hypothetical protein
MKTLRTFLLFIIAGGLFTTADAQYYYGPPPGPPPPAPRHERAQHESGDDEGVSPTGYFGVSIGLANPVSGFADNLGKGYGGYALPGDNIDISLNIPVNHSNMGVAIMYGYYANDFDLNSYVNTLQIADQSKSYAGITSGTYAENFIMVGGFITYPINRLSFDFKLMGGFAFCALPEVDYGANYNPATGLYDYEWDNYASRSTSFAFSFGADLRYRFRRSSLLLGVDYIGADPIINSTQQYADPNNIYYVYNHLGGGLPISVVSVNLGIAYDIR